MPAGASRPAATRWRCSARPAAARACWRWTRTMRSCSPRARRAVRRTTGSSSSAVHIADILHEVGVPYCKGGVMAKNPQWRGSLATWRERIARLDRAARSPQDLCCRSTSSSTCGRCTATAACARRSGAKAFDAARGKVSFAKLLAEAAGGVAKRARLVRPVQDQPGPDRSQKRRAVRHRHHGARARGPPPCGGALDPGATCRHQGARHRRRKRSRRADRGARNLPRLFCWRSRSHDIEHGTPPSNAVAVKRLSSRDRDRLRSALETVEHVDDVMRGLLF